MTMEVHDSESDDEIPFGCAKKKLNGFKLLIYLFFRWEEKVSPNNRIFYVK